MRIVYLLTVVVLTMATACFTPNTPPPFLKVNDPAWNTWLNTKVDIAIKEVPMGDLPNRPPFEGLKMVLNGIDGSSAITMEGEQTTRRQALEKMAFKYNLTMSAVTKPGETPTIVFSNREARPGITPLK